MGTSWSALQRDLRCAFEVAGEEMPYRGVRGRARVTIEPDEGLATLAQLVTRYLGGTDGAFAGRLLARTAPEVVLRLDPIEISSWGLLEAHEGVITAPGRWRERALSTIHR